jgi:predicted acylesterase/phospholipase RssA
VYKFWPGGLLEGIFKKSGILDSQPLVDFVIDQTHGRTVKKKVSFALCETTEGDYHMFDYNASDTLPDFYVKSAIGSSSIPLVFPSVKKDDKIYVDGGSIWNIDIPSAVRRCKEVVDNDEDIIVDMILCGSNPPVSGPKKDLSKFSALSHYQRAQEIKSFYDTMNKVERGMSLFPQVNFRYIVSPSESLSASSNPIPLDFSTDHLNKCFDIGRKDAKNAVKLGSQKYFEVVKEYRDKLLNGERVNLANMIDERVAQMDGRTTQNASS